MAVSVRVAHSGFIS